MNIAIIDASNMGTAMGAAWTAKGHKRLFSFSTRPERLTNAASKAGPGSSIGTSIEAVTFGDVILFCVPWWRYRRRSMQRDLSTEASLQ
jgi:predicted dinucleotide-binding enzyme